MNQMRLLITLPMVFTLSIGTVGVAMTQAGEEITNSIGMKLVLIPKGTFMMGSPTSEPGRRDNERQHEVRITQPYWIGVYEVTQSEYERVMGTNPSSFKGADRPVESVSWEDAVEFCRRLSDLPEEKAAGRVYRLPTEAEWEYACRAGMTTAYNCGDDASQLGAHGWFTSNSFISNSGHQTHPVGQKQPNAWGLYDMHGNVWEWCSDFFGGYPAGSVADPKGPRKGSVRVYRGGSWNWVPEGSRSAHRRGDFPSLRRNNLGFRVALSSSGIRE